MVHKNLEVIWLNVRMLGRSSEKVLRVLHDELVERRRRRNEHRAGCPAAAPRTPGTLPSGSNRNPHNPPSHKRPVTQYRSPTPVHSWSRLRGFGLRATHVRSRADPPASSPRDSRGPVPPGQASADSPAANT